jgi:tetratricopeptide (TPR) repeat protein
MKMKKLITVAAILICSGILSAQEVVDYILKARAYADAGKAGQAISALNTAIAVKKESRLFVQRADVRISEGDYSGAISDYNEANSLVPASGEYGLSRVYALKGDASTSVYHLEMNLRSAFRRSEKEIMLDPAYGPVENTPVWRQFWKKDWYSFSEKRISEIEYYTNAGKTSDAEAVLNDLKSNSQDGDDILYAEALISLSSGKPAEAVKTISQLVTIYPENVKYLKILAKAQTAESNPAGASVTYSRIISSGFADAELFILRAECYKKTGETGKALIDIEKYLDLYPENRTALSLAGKVEAVSGDNIKALEYFSKNLELHPNDADCYNDRANSYFVSRSWDWAIKDYSMSLDLKPDNSDTWLNKGISLLNLQKTEDACHDFRKSMSLGNKRASEYISRECIK